MSFVKEQWPRVDRDVVDSPAVATSALSWSEGRLYRFGVQHQLLSGSLHYFRVVPQLWRDRLLRVMDMGLNTVDTYVPWNFHQPSRGSVPDFSDWRDVERFVALAGEMGLDVVLRPGPYICAEWSNGGLPIWVTSSLTPVRSSERRYLDAVETWFDTLIPRLASLQTAQGGPVVAFQVENEFGSFGDDTEYPVWLAKTLRRLGVTEMLYTADGPTDLMQDGGSIPGILAAATLGSKPGQARQLLRDRRDGEPFFVAEFWNGWFDHWGQNHHVRPAEDVGHTVADILQDGGSVSLYMAHGGTNFALWSGANVVDGAVRGTTTSYDSDAPIAEDGRLTEKFFALRNVLGRNGESLVSTEPQILPATTTHLRPILGLDEALSGFSHGEPARQERVSFDAMDLHGGLAVYEALIMLPPSEIELTISDVADRALIYLDGTFVGAVEGSGSVMVAGCGRTASLRIVVESLGRVNYGPELGKPKGLLGAVLLGRRQIQRWTTTPVRLESIVPSTLAALPRTTVSLAEADAGWWRAQIDLPTVGDTHLSLPGSVKGYVWVNDFFLGRYWNIGPQTSLYVPGPILKTGANTIDVLEMHSAGRTIILSPNPDLGPTETYIEEF